MVVGVATQVLLLRAAEGRQRRDYQTTQVILQEEDPNDVVSV